MLLRSLESHAGLEIIYHKTGKMTSIKLFFFSNACARELSRVPDQLKLMPESQNQPWNNSSQILSDNSHLPSHIPKWAVMLPLNCTILWLNRLYIVVSYVNSFWARSVLWKWDYRSYHWANLVTLVQNWHSIARIVDYKCFVQLADDSSWVHDAITEMLCPFLQFPFYSLANQKHWAATENAFSLKAATATQQ